MVIPALILFVLVEVIQAWLILFEKRVARGTRRLILTEVLELPLELYLILRGETLVILIVIAIMIFQWLTIAVLFSFLR